MSEAAGLCGYAFDKYKKKDENNDKKFNLKEIAVTDLSAGESAERLKFAAAQIATRELANEPGNVINPPPEKTEKPSRNQVQRLLVNCLRMMITINL